MMTSFCGDCRKRLVYIGAMDSKSSTIVLFKVMSGPFRKGICVLAIHRLHETAKQY